MRKVTVVAPPKPGGGGGTVVPPGALPEAFKGNGMWIWEAGRSEGGDPVAIAARAHSAGMSTVFVKSSDGASSRWPQFNPDLRGRPEGPRA